MNILYTALCYFISNIILITRIAYMQNDEKLIARKLLINYTQQSPQAFNREYRVISHERQIHTLLLRKETFTTSQIEGCIKKNVIRN